MSENKNENETIQTRSAWSHICECITWVIFFSLCFAYCARSEIVEILK